MQILKIFMDPTQPDPYTSANFVTQPEPGL